MGRQFFLFCGCGGNEIGEPVTPFVKRSRSGASLARVKSGTVEGVFVRLVSSHTWNTLGGTPSPAASRNFRRNGSQMMATNSRWFGSLNFRLLVLMALTGGGVLSDGCVCGGILKLGSKNEVRCALRLCCGVDNQLVVVLQSFEPVLNIGGGVGILQAFHLCRIE